MSRYVTPFLVLNLGSEMLFVVSQRLQAQNISPERSTHVLDELTSCLISQEMISELVKPQEVSDHASMKQLIEDIAQCSIMRLDSVSMDRLWDLITMVFKWQITLCKDVIAVTSRHLYEIETFTTNPETQLQLHKVQNLIDSFNSILKPEEKYNLRQSILIWLDSFNVRISLLLRLGFQNQDGSFKLDNFDPRYVSMLENIGENVYSATKNLNISKSLPKTEEQKMEKQEINSMITQILGEDVDSNNIDDTRIFRLTLGETYEDNNTSTQKSEIYSPISVENSKDLLQNILEDIVHTTEESSTTDNIHDELLNIIDESC